MGQSKWQIEIYMHFWVRKDDEVVELHLFFRSSEKTNFFFQLEHTTKIGEIDKSQKTHLLFFFLPIGFVLFYWNNSTFTLCQNDL